jgi:hypothetical protein
MTCEYLAGSSDLQEGGQHERGDDPGRNAERPDELR